MSANNVITGTIEGAKLHLDGKVEVDFKSAAGAQQQVFLPDQRTLPERFFKSATDAFTPGASIELTTDGEPDRPTVVAVSVAGQKVYEAPKR